MEDRRVFRFSVKDNLLNEEVTPDNISLPLLSDFVQQVAAFLRGSSRIDLGEIKTRIIEGSFAVAVYDETGLLDEAYEDYTKIKSQGSLDDVNPARASVLLEWQRAAVANSDRSYSLGYELDGSGLDQLFIDSSSDYRIAEETWVLSELYVYGRVFDMGGKNSTNVHIELENGNTLKASTKPEVLRTDSENRLYKKQLVRIVAEQNIDTLETRKEKLISFETYNPVYDETQFESISRRIKAAWSSVEDINSWVENVRGVSG